MNRPSQPAEGSELLPSLLVVEDEPVTRRYLQAALQRTGKYEVHVAEDVPAAVEVLHERPVQLVLSDIGLPGQDGFALLRRVRREPRLWDIPFFFLTGHTSHATKIRGFHQGLDAFLEKPIVLPEVIARIDCALTRIERNLARRLVRNYELAGRFSGLSFPDLVTILENAQRTGKIAVLARREAGVVYVNRGRIHHATFGNLEGAEAFNRIFEHEEGQFEFCPGEFDMEEVPRSIGKPATALMLEAARRLDTRRRDRQRRDAGEAVEAPAGVVEVVNLDSGFGSPDEEFIETAPVRLVADRIAKSLSDPFELGELEYLGREDLAAMTDESARDERLLVWLLADKVEAVPVLSALAGPLGDDQIVRSLGEAPKLLSLTFDVEAGRAVHVLVVDQQAPVVFEDLETRDGILLVAPRQGSWASFPVAAQVAFKELLKKHRPGLVYALGDDSVSGAARRAVDEEALDVQVKGSERSLGAAELRFRLVLADVLRQWARAGRRRLRPTA